MIHTVVPNGGVVFSTNDPATLEADLRYYRMHNGSFTVGGDLRANVQALDMTYRSQLSGGHVVFSTGDSFGNEDLWLWNLRDEHRRHRRGDGRGALRGPHARRQGPLFDRDGAGQRQDLALYHHTSGANDSVASSPDNELFEAFLPNSDVIFAVETAAGRQLKRYNVVTGLVDVIAAASGDDFWLTEVLSNGMVVYTRTGASPGLHVWNPITGASTPVAGRGHLRGRRRSRRLHRLGELGIPDDLALWDASMSQLVMITQTAEHEQFGCVFDDGTVLFSRVMPLGVTTDLFKWNQATRQEVRLNRRYRQPLGGGRHPRGALRLLFEGALSTAPRQREISSRWRGAFISRARAPGDARR